MTSWSRIEALNEVRKDLWRYLSAAAHPEAIASIAEGLFRLPRGDIRRLTAAHLLLEKSTTEMLDAIHRLLPRMPANARLIEQELVGHVIGPVDWLRTRQLQLSSGDRRRFLCYPPDRHYDTSLGRLVLYDLRACEVLAAGALLRGSSGPTERMLKSVRDRGRRLTKHSKLSGLRHIRPATNELAGLAQRRGVAPLTDFASRYMDAFERLEPSTTRSVIQSQLLAPSSDATLYELQVGFRIVRCFEALGYRRASPRIIEPRGQPPFALLRKGPERVEIWWQRTVRSKMGLGEGLYSKALADANLQQAPLLPDFIVVFESTRRALLVEIKHSSQDRTPVHAGIKDCLLYLMDARAWFNTQPFPHALVIASNVQTPSVVSGRILVSSEAFADVCALIALAIEAHSSNTPFGTLKD